MEQAFMRVNDHQAFHKFSDFEEVVSSGNVEEIVKYYNSHKEILEEVDNQGNLAIHYVVMEGRLDVLKALCDIDKNIIYKRSNSGVSLFMYACFYGHLNIVNYLLEKNPEFLKQKDASGNNIMHCISRQFINEEKLDAEKIKSVVEHLHNIASGLIFSKNIKSQTPLFNAVDSSNYVLVRYFLTKKPSLMKEKDKDGMYPIHAVSENEDLDMIKLLYDFDKKCLGYKDSDGETILGRSVWLGHLNTVKYLCENHKDLMNVQDHKENNILHLAAKSNRMDVAKYLIENKPDLLNRKNKAGYLPFQLAQLEKYLDLAKYLVEKRSALFPVTAPQKSQNTSKIQRKKGQKSRGRGQQKSQNLVKGALLEREVVSNPVQDKQEIKFPERISLYNPVKSDKGKEEFIPEIKEVESLPVLEEKPKEAKRKKIIRVLNPSVKSLLWKENKDKTPEEKEITKRKKHQEFVLADNPEMSLSRSHLSITDSESQSIASFMTQSECDGQGADELMRLAYPQLHRLLKRQGQKEINQIHFKNSNVIRITLAQLKVYKLIDGTISQKGIHVTKKGECESVFIAHTTHGAGMHEKWYNDPNVVKQFFAFIKECDPTIKEYFESLSWKEDSKESGFDGDRANEGGEG